MIDFKTVLSLITIILVVISYVPYLRDIFRGTTTPHAFSFFIWGFGGLLTYLLQVHGGAGVGSWITLAITLICIFVFFLSLFYGEKNITKSDIVFFFLSLLALFLWIFVHEPIWSVILIVAVDIFGFVPTIRKSWNKPYSETLFLYELCVIRHTLGIFALEQFNILTLLYPVSWTIANLLFVIFLLIRRRKIVK